jgi:hypothetical protein
MLKQVTTRMLFTFLLLALALAVPASASADAPLINQTMEVGFAVPKGAKPAKACTGALSINVPVGKKTVKKKRLTVFASKKVTLAYTDGFCSATAIVQVPASLVGQTLKVVTRFKGNSVIKKFKSTSKYVIYAPTLPVPPLPEPPAPPPPPAPEPPQLHSKGYWEATIVGTGYPHFAFVIGDDQKVTTINQFNTTLFTCAASSTSAYYNAGPYPKSFSVVDDKASMSTTTTASGGVTVQSSFNFNFGAKTGTGTLVQTGSIMAPPAGGGASTLRTGCTTGTLQLTLQWKPPT